MNKKAYMFILDVMIALIISVAGFSLLLYNSGFDKKSTFFSEQLSEDVIGVMSHTNINDLCMHIKKGNCECPNYKELENVVCSRVLENTNVSLTAMMSEVIETGTMETNNVTKIIEEIFVINNVTDTNRFGFAVLYTKPNSIPGVNPDTLELYNSGK